MFKNCSDLRRYLKEFICVDCVSYLKSVLLEFEFFRQKWYQVLGEMNMCVPFCKI